MSLANSGNSGGDGDCILCREKRWTLVLRAEDMEYACKPGPFDLVACASCGHVYKHPMPAPEEVASLYPPTYYTVNKKSPLYLDGPIYEQKLVKDARKLRRQTQGLDIRSIVDIGGGDIQRLIKVKEAFGQEVEAIAFDLQFEEEWIRKAASHGVKVVVGNVETDIEALTDNGHDLIVMRQLLEHLRHPEIAVRNVFRKLRPNGIVIIDTPNRGGLDYHLWKDHYWGGYHLPRHFHLFTMPSLTRLMKDAGFHIYEQGYLPSLGFWVMSLRNKLGLNSVERKNSFWEFLYFKNIPLSVAFILFDWVRIKLGFQSSNQFIIGQKK
ncbi:MAG: class I SAM-dependent methyltransferase [Verrucomicrobiales bacterium]|nr:class I SAM-dependent methyltransferase [Verrucomicrobiales bacterium]